MNPNFLDFEQPIAELEGKIEELRHASSGQAFNIDEEVSRLREKLKLKTAEIFRNLAPWQVSQVSRHPGRPYTLDYIQGMCEESHPLNGDPMLAYDQALVAGPARNHRRPILPLVPQKRPHTKSQVNLHFASPIPQG